MTPQFHVGHTVYLTNIILLSAAILLFGQHALAQQPSQPALRGILVLEKSHSVALDATVL